MIEFESNLVVVVGYGRLGLPDIDQALHRASHHPLMRSDLDILVNLRDVEQLDLDHAGLAELARRDEIASRKVPHPRRVAIVATDDYNFGVSRMYQSLSLEGPAEVRVFRDLFLAKAWLTGPREPDWRSQRRDGSDTQRR